MTYNQLIFWENRVNELEIQLTTWRETFGVGTPSQAKEILQKAQRDLDQMTRCWKIRGLALRKPCPKCGYTSIITGIE